MKSATKKGKGKNVRNANSNARNSNPSIGAIAAAFKRGGGNSARAGIGTAVSDRGAGGRGEIHGRGTEGEIAPDGIGTGYSEGAERGNFGGDFGGVGNRGTGTGTGAGGGGSSTSGTGTGTGSGAGTETEFDREARRQAEQFVEERKPKRGRPAGSKKAKTVTAGAPNENAGLLSLLLVSVSYGVSQFAGQHWRVERDEAMSLAVPLQIAVERTIPEDWLKVYEAILEKYAPWAAVAFVWGRAINTRIEYGRLIEAQRRAARNGIPQPGQSNDSAASTGFGGNDSASA